MEIGEREAFGVGEIVGRRWCYNPARVRERALPAGIAIVTAIAR